MTDTPTPTRPSDPATLDIEYEGEALPQVEILNLFGDITKQLGGVPCSGHLDFAAGTWTFHRERECAS